MLQLATALSGWYRSMKLCTSHHFAQISWIKEVRTSSLPSSSSEDISSTITFCSYFCSCSSSVLSSSLWSSSNSSTSSLLTSKPMFLPRILLTLILPAYHSMILTACVFITRDTVRHPRRFVFGKFVHKPNCSWSEAFHWGLTVYVLLLITLRLHRSVTSLLMVVLSQLPFFILGHNNLWIYICIHLIQHNCQLNSVGYCLGCYMYDVAINTYTWCTDSLVTSQPYTLKLAGKTVSSCLLFLTGLSALANLFYNFPFLCNSEV